MRRILVLLAAVALLTGCSTSTPPADPNGPDELTAMVCQDEVRQELAAALGTDTPQAPRAHWTKPTFTCRYVYENGGFTMTVTEYADQPATEAAFTTRRESATDPQDLPGVGDAAYATPDGSVFFRKDTKTMAIDVSGLPAQFGKPAIGRDAVALNIVATVLHCWKEQAS